MKKVLLIVMDWKLIIDIFWYKNLINYLVLFCVFIFVGNVVMKYFVGFFRDYLCKILFCKINVECVIWYLSVILLCCYLNYCFIF